MFTFRERRKFLNARGNVVFMSTKTLLLPGFGGQALLTVAGGANGSDYLDASKAATLLLQVTAHSGNGTTISLQESTDGVNWGDLTDFATLAQASFATTVATMKKLNSQSGPFGMIRLQSDGTTGSTTVRIVGLALPITN